MKPIRVLLVEDHLVVREGLHYMLSAQPDIKVVGEAATGRQAVTLAREHHPDVIVLDISMPDMDGLEAAGLIRLESPQSQILILTMHESDTYFFKAIEIGVAGYLPKKAASEDLLQAVRAVAQGDAFFYPSLARKLLEGYRQHSPSDSLPGPPGYQNLSEREKEVMFLLIQGFSNQQIAEKLVVSPSTAQTHRTHILQKLNLENTIDLVRYAIRHGLIEP